MPEKKGLDAGLNLEQRRQRFFERERRDAAKWLELTPRQRRQPYWQAREAQWQNAAKIGLILQTAGEQLPAPLARLLAPPPAPPPPGSPSLFAPCLADAPHRAPTGRAHGLKADGGTPWGSRWGSRWPRSVQRGS